MKWIYLLLFMMIYFIVTACSIPLPCKIPALTHQQLIQVSLNDEFTLHKNQTAIISNTDLRIKIVEFYNSPCPPGAQCIWSGVGISFEYQFGNETIHGIDAHQAFGYEINVLDTDYETYAILKVARIN